MDGRDEGLLSPLTHVLHVAELTKQNTASSEMVLPDPGVSSDAASLLYNMSGTKVSVSLVCFVPLGSPVNMHFVFLFYYGWRREIISY